MAFENVKHLGNPTNTIEILDKYGFSFQKKTYQQFGFVKVNYLSLDKLLGIF